MTKAIVRWLALAVWGFISGLAAGTATVAVTAVDPGGLTAKQTFAVTAEVAGDHRSILEALYQATNGPGWTESTNWLTDEPLSEWYGVTTDAAGSVTQLSLYRNELTGPIPVELGDLSSLTSLNLSLNGLTGPIPVELGDLSSLTSLNLSLNGLTGPIPVELGDLSSLTSLNLSLNGLTGPIPVELGDLSSLTSLDLSWNRSRILSSDGLTGPIPVELGNLDSLTSLFLLGNGLTGPIPVELGDLSSLTSLNLSSNNLVGPVPAWLQRLTQLRSLSLSFNRLTGTIPAELGDLVNLQTLYLTGNELTGSIPSELGGLSNLRNLSLGWNRLTGEIPTALGGLANLDYLDLGRGRWSRSYYSLGNELSGSIPSELGGLENLTFLDLGGNRLTGEIPTALGGLANLDYLNLGRNGLTGPIPSQLGSLVNLQSLYLYATDLTGAIPPELGNLAKLRNLDLSYTWGLTGPLPAGLEPEESEGVDEETSLEELDIFVTQTCAPVGWADWLATIEFYGPLCEVDTNVIDVAVVYTPTAREAAGGTAAVGAAIDLMIAETNQAYEDSGVRHRLALVARSEVSYTETSSSLDLYRLEQPSDGFMDEVPTLRDETGADLVHLIVAFPYNVCGQARLPGSLGVTALECGGAVFAHELGHNFGLRHDRFRVRSEGGVSPHPGYGYVNQQASENLPPSRRWRTIMAYSSDCYYLSEAGCPRLLRFSNPRQSHNGDPLGVAFGSGSGVTGAADAVSVLNAMGPMVVDWRERPEGGSVNQPPVAVGTLGDRSLTSLGSVLSVDVSHAFEDPDGDALTYTVLSTVPWVVRASATGALVTLRAVGSGAATVRVSASDTGGLSVSRSFSATVVGGSSLTDDGVAATGGVASDRAALEALYRDAGGPSWTDDANWDTAAPLAEWYGVKTDVAGRVTELHLDGDGLTGPIPTALGRLTALRVLSIGGNDLAPGPIPAWVGGLVRLEALGLENTNRTGSIPGWLGELSHLRWLNLDDNDLTGSIPPRLGLLVNLRGLGLGGNNLTAGPIPAWLDGLTSLEWLSLWETNRTGPIPATLASLVNLRGLYLSNNSLTGSVPGSLGALVNLEHLDIGGNQFTGMVPNSLGSLDRITHLGLADSQMTGAIPGWLASLDNLEYLDLAGNQLTGTIPSFLLSFDNLTYLWLHDNRFSGPIPAWLGSLAGLESLTLSGNPLMTGPLPGSLEVLSLDHFWMDACVPPILQTWVQTIPDFQGSVCAR